jgi:hypothetical protein
MRSLASRPRRLARSDEGRAHGGQVQLGLTAKEIARVKERIQDLLADIDAGKIKIQ